MTPLETFKWGEISRGRYYLPATIYEKINHDILIDSRGKQSERMPNDITDLSEGFSILEGSIQSTRDI